MTVSNLGFITNTGNLPNNWSINKFPLLVNTSRFDISNTPITNRWKFFCSALSNLGLESSVNYIYSLCNAKSSAAVVPDTYLVLKKCSQPVLKVSYVTTTCKGMKKICPIIFTQNYFLLVIIIIILF